MAKCILRPGWAVFPLLLAASNLVVHWPCWRWHKANNPFWTWIQIPKITWASMGDFFFWYEIKCFSEIYLSHDLDLSTFDPWPWPIGQKEVGNIFCSDDRISHWDMTLIYIYLWDRWRNTPTDAMLFHKSSL